jgi:chromosome segregation ATPase
MQEIAQHNLVVSYPLPPLDDIRSEIVLCENSLSGMGAVNLRSIEDYDEKKARHVELRAETKRLEDQRDQLVALTDQLNERKKVNLVKVFDAVNAEMVANRVKKSSGTAQFVQISLRKVTLNKADHIIGVTKPAGGISNVIFKPHIGDFSELEKEIGLPEEKARRDGE